MAYLLSFSGAQIDAAIARALEIGTAAELLAELRTVDGAGSGLDADLLDGQHAAAFAAASHTHSKSAITDLETITTIPTAHAVPKAGADGKLNSGWIPAIGGGASSYIFDVKAYGAKGDGSTDDTDAIKGAINAAEAAAVKANYRSVVTVYVPTGKYKITSQITVPSGVVLECDGIIYNHLSDAWQYAILVSPGGHIKRLQMWGNLGSGVKCGTTGQYANMYIGEVRLWNMGESYDSGKGPQVAMQLTGYNFTIDAVEIDGGNIGLDINIASDVRLDKALLFTGSTGCRITSASEHISIGTLVIDTPNYIGMQIDSSHDVYIANCLIFLNDNEYNGSLNYAIDVGNYSSANKVNNLWLNARVQNTGGCALRLSNIKASTINLVVTNALLETGNDHPTTTGITYDTGVEASVHINANIDTDVTTAISGSVAGTIFLSRGAEFYKQDGSGGIKLFDSGSGGGGGGDADTVDGFHASATPQAGKLLALDSNAKLPASITGDADTVDGQHASAFAAASHTHTKSAITDLETITTTATANAVPKADSGGKIALGWLRTGSGQGLDADTVDGQHASAFASASHTHTKSAITDLETITATPTAYAVPKAGADGKIDSGWIPSGGGGGDADTVDGFHASATAQAGKLLALDSNAKLPASITGDADTVDGQHASSFAAASHTHTKSNITDLETITTTPTANAVPKADSSGKIASGWLPSGGGGTSYNNLFTWLRYSGTVKYAAAMIGPLTTASATANRHYYIPFVAPRNISVTALQCRVTTAASGVADIGIYSSTTDANGNIIPYQRLAWISDIDTSTAGEKSGSVSVNLTAGEVYFMALRCSGTPTLAAANANYVAASFGHSPSTATPSTFLYVTNTGSLPETAPSSGYTMSAGGNVPVAGFMED